jgi:hypothetical protein
LRESELLKTIAMMVVQALFIYEWTYFAPMGVKWQWACCNMAPNYVLDVRYFHQTTAPWLITAALIGVVTRRLLILTAEKRDPQVRRRLYAICDEAEYSGSRLPRWLAALASAMVTTLLLLGFAGSLTRAAVIFAIVAGILLVRIYAFPTISLWKAWSMRAAAYPAIVRLVVAVVATYFICRLILMVPAFSTYPYRGQTETSFGPELTAILVGFVLLLALLPNGALATEEPLAANTPLPKLPIPSSVAQAVIVVCFVLISTKKLFAGLCSDPYCCFGGDNGLASSSVAGGIPSGAAVTNPLSGPEAAAAAASRAKPGSGHPVRDLSPALPPARLISIIKSPFSTPSQVAHAIAMLKEKSTPHAQQTGGELSGSAPAGAQETQQTGGELSGSAPAGAQETSSGRQSVKNPFSGLRG